MCFKKRLLIMDESATLKRPLKITVVGDGTVGKTCLLIAYTTNEFPKDYVPTVFDNYSGEHSVNGKTYSMTLWDTAGQEEYERLRPLSYPQTDVFILCFALDNKVSIDNVSSKWVPELKRHCQETPIILVGTKKDIHNYAEIPPKRGHKLSKKEGLTTYLECSAKTREGIDEVFNQSIMAAVGIKKKKRSCIIM